MLIISEFCKQVPNKQSKQNKQTSKKEQKKEACSNAPYSASSTRFQRLHLKEGLGKAGSISPASWHQWKNISAGCLSLRVLPFTSFRPSLIFGFIPLLNQSLQYCSVYCMQLITKMSDFGRYDVLPLLSVQWHWAVKKVTSFSCASHTEKKQLQTVPTFFNKSIYLFFLPFFFFPLFLTGISESPTCDVKFLCT